MVSEVLSDMQKEKVDRRMTNAYWGSGGSTRFCICIFFPGPVTQFYGSPPPLCSMTSYRSIMHYDDCKYFLKKESVSLLSTFSEIL